MARRERADGGFGLLTVIWTVLLLAAAAGLLAIWEIHRPGPAASDTTFVVEKGAGVSTIGAGLESKGLIRSRHAFRLASIFYASDASMKAGEYEVRAGESTRELLEKIESGKSRLFAVTVPEGRTSAQVIEILAAAQFLTGDVPPVPPEGSVLPDTFHVPSGMDRTVLLNKMKKAHDDTLAELWAKRAANIPIKTPEEAVILASIVEKETGIGSERPQVAAVFINRLNKGMRLQSDPTIIYGICKCPRLTDSQGKPRGIRRSEIDRATPYNTYAIDGLPPGPIANPGRASIEAVLNPPATNDLYFVALDPFDPSKGHVFSATYDAHNAAVARLRAAEQAALAERAKASP